MKNKGRLHFRAINQQRGWTFWSMMFVMAVVLLGAYIGMQLVPIYASNETIIKAMEQSLDGENLRMVNRSLIIKKMNAQLYLDGAHEILDYKTDLHVRRSRTKMTVEINYQREVPLFFNLSLVAKFDNIVERNI